MNLGRHIIGSILGAVLCTGIGLAAEPAEVEKFVNARVEIGEMMMNYFQGGERFGEGRSGKRAQEALVRRRGFDQITSFEADIGRTVVDFIGNGFPTHSLLLVEIDILDLSRDRACAAGLLPWAYLFRRKRREIGKGIEPVTPT